jgi:signal peptidase I
MTGFAVMSTAVLAGFVALYLYVLATDPGPYPPTFSISLGNNILITAAKEQGGDIVVFNRGTPYVGSALSIKGRNEAVNIGGWDKYGIYYRRVRHVGEKDWFTLMISLWYPIIGFSIAPIIFIIILGRRRYDQADGNPVIRENI